LDKLSSDDEFRSRFQANPREAVRSLGTDDPAVDSLPETPMPNLADKKTLSASRGKFRDQLVSSGFPFTPIHLDLPER
jgi:putative modified peptide